MRSRNGDRPLSLAIYALILTSLLGADEYIISYRAVVSDAILVSERLSISRTMQRCQGSPGAFVLLETAGEADLDNIIQHDFDLFFTLMQQTALHVDHDEHSIDSIGKSQTVLSMPPQCFTVDINQDLAKITALK